MNESAKNPVAQIAKLGQFNVLVNIHFTDGTEQTIDVYVWKDQGGCLVLQWTDENGHQVFRCIPHEHIKYYDVRPRKETQPRGIIQ